MLNSTTIEGRLATEPQGRFTASGHRLVSFVLAVPRDAIHGQERPPNYLRIIGWGPQADFAIKCLYKGRHIAIDGRLDQRSYTDSEGVRRSIVQIVARNFSPLDKPIKERQIE